jgi:glycosyltransferase involved in cell wall biosynthesis
VQRTIDSPADRPDQPPVPLVVIAAHEEGPRIEATIGALRAAFPGAPLWVADDGSRDGTAEIARAAGARVHRLACNVGKGRAMEQTLAQALAQEPSHGVVLLCDGDLGASAGALVALTGAVGSGQADLAVAEFASSVGGGFGVALGFARWAIERRCGLTTRAPISGQRALNARALEAVRPLAGGFGMEMAMTIDAARAGCTILELRLELSHRATGRTPAGFLHRVRQLGDFTRVYRSRR